MQRGVELPRELTPPEWATLTGELRETFGTAGRVISRGSAHEWIGDDVHAFLEPTGTGHRLRLEARRSPLTVGAAAGGFGVFAGLLALLTSALDAATFGPVLEVLLPVLLVLIGAGAVGNSTLKLRRWADDREDLMDQVIDRARRLTDAPTPEQAG